MPLLTELVRIQGEALLYKYGAPNGAGEGAFSLWGGVPGSSRLAPTTSLLRSLRSVTAHMANAPYVRDAGNRLKSVLLPKPNAKIHRR